jgi:deoxyribonucleoside regulator
MMGWHNMNEKEERKLNMLAEIASLYYEHDLTQSEIAKKMFISRSRISRLLKQAKEKGIVDININFVGERCYEHENYLINTYGLKDVRIYNNRNKTDKETLYGIGQFGAKYLLENITDTTFLGVTWGRTLYETVKSLKVKEKRPIDVIQIIGSAATMSDYFNSTECVRIAAKLLGGRAHYLNAPLYMEDDYARKTLLNDYFISTTLKFGERADVILTGIGSMTYENYMRLFRGYCSNEVFEQIKKQDAVGYICAHFYNRNGEFLNNDINRRIIGIDVNYLKNAKTVIGVAGGKGKAEAIKGAIKGKLINVLITDFKTANEILVSN